MESINFRSFSIFNMIASLTYILCSKFLSAFLLLILGTICSLFLLVCEHVYVRYIRKAVTQTHKKGQNSRKTNCFSVLRRVIIEHSVVVEIIFFPQSFSHSTDSLMVRSCSIPESLACEWEANSGSYQTSSCRLFQPYNTSEYRLATSHDRYAVRVCWYFLFVKVFPRS